MGTSRRVAGCAASLVVLLSVYLLGAGAWGQVPALAASPLSPGLFGARAVASTPLASLGAGQLWYGETFLFALVADAGGWTAYQRAQTVASRLAALTEQGRLTGPASLLVAPGPEGAWVVVAPTPGDAGGPPEPVLMVDGPTARYYGLPPGRLAALWRRRLVGLRSSATGGPLQQPEGTQGGSAVPSPPGFHGEISDLKLVEESAPEQVAPLAGGSDLDLVAMARWALRALKLNPRPNLDYECRFSILLLGYPPAPGPDDHDPITIADTESRMDWEFGYMKDMTGDNSADEVARGVRRRLMSYLHEDGNCYPPNVAGTYLPPTFTHNWVNGKLLISLANDYARTHDEPLRSPCRKLFEGLRAEADWVEGRAYYAGGNVMWSPVHGWGAGGDSPYHPAMTLEAVATYYDVFRDQEALDFAVAFAEGEMANDQARYGVLSDPEKLKHLTPAERQYMPGLEIFFNDQATRDLGVRPDGSFDHHSHMRGHNGWGMAHVAALTREPRLVAWCRRLLDFYLRRGTDYGWIPESMTIPARSETCAVADVLNLAEGVAQAGHPEYWDTVERFVRNYLREAQFFLTPDYQALYRQLHPGEAGEQGLERAREFEGGFQGAMGLTDRCYVPNEMDMMGCCVPEGMRSIHTAWKDTVTDEANGIHVNMGFDRDAPAARVTSFAPYRGGLRVVAKVSRDFWLRPPTWAPPERVRLLREGQPVALQWQGGYLQVPGVRAGEELTLTYPLVSFVQRQTIPSQAGLPDRVVTVTWLGNTVLSVAPPGGQLPLYTDAPRPLPPMP